MHSSLNPEKIMGQIGMTVTGKFILKSCSMKIMLTFINLGVQYYDLLLLAAM
jgi:hypothetical protein